MEVVYFILLVGVLIFVHELGHFTWAKIFGVKVLKFSLGFGPKIVGFSRGETEYVIAAFPLGGYVRMLGESPHDQVSEADDGRAFSQLPLAKRAIIVCAGPAMNLALPVVLFFVVFAGDTQMTPAVIGTVYPDQPAWGVLQPGDRILEVDGEEITTFYELGRIIRERPNLETELSLERDDERVRVTVTPAMRLENRWLDRPAQVGRIGVKPHHPLAVVGVTSPSSPAAAARLRTFDRVIAAAGRPVTRWIDLQQALGGNRGSMVPLTYMRPTRVEGALGGLVDFEIYEPHVATVTPEPGPGDGLSRAGLEAVDLYVSHVTVSSDRTEIGVRPGDRVVTLDGRHVQLWATLIEDLEQTTDRVHQLSWQRGDQVITRSYRLRPARLATGDDRDQRILVSSPDGDRHLATLGQWHPVALDPAIENPHTVTYAIDQALRSSAELVELTVWSVVRMFQGRLSVREIGGPIRVFEATEAAAREGALNYLSLMALISINLGLINLLPIPMLDGGHLMFFLIEAVARRPVSTRVREAASLVGLLLLLALMVLAFKNDLERQWPRIVDAFSEESDG